MRYAFRSKPLNDDPYSLSWYYYSEATADVIILGNSRALHNYDAKMISDSIGMNVKNIAMDGTSAIYQSCILQKIIKRHKPKIVFFEYLESYLDGHGNNLENQDYIKDLYYEDNFVKAKLDAIDAYSPIKELSSVYRLTGLNSLSFINNLRGRGTHEYLKKGFRPLPDKTIEYPKMSYRRYLFPKIDSIELQSIEDIVFMCHKNNVKLVVTISPTLNLTYPSNSITLHALCARLHIPIIDNSIVQGIGDEMFKDKIHMNAKGAEMYTKCIIIPAHVFNFAKTR